MKVVFLTRYDEAGASSRYRIYQYLPYFSLKGIEFVVSPLLDKQYIKNINNNTQTSKISLFLQYFKRLFFLIKKRQYDFLFIEKEIFPFLPDFIFLLKIFKIKYIVDFDDAIFHNYDTTFARNKIIPILLGKKIPSMIKNASSVICGSPYLTHYSLKYNQKVFEIPTTIDFEKYERRRIMSISEKFIIGWIGSKSTSKHLAIISEALVKFCLDFDCQLNLIGFDISLKHIFQNNIAVRFIEWNDLTEVEEICKFDVGVMPLPDEPFERGKCGFKLIQYMACGIPTISTPLEANVKINKDNGNLFASTQEDWYSSFVQVYRERRVFKEIGKKNIEIVKNYYSIEVNVNKYIELFENIT
jgi:glycosyltransferase involved in cell wall biosynthesis